MAQKKKKGHRARKPAKDQEGEGSDTGEFDVTTGVPEQDEVVRACNEFERSPHRSPPSDLCGHRELSASQTGNLGFFIYVPIMFASSFSIS